MSTLQVVLLLAFGCVLVGGSILLRVSSAGRYEVKPTDLVFIVVPLLVAGVATGKLTGLDFFGVRADLSALWAEAADTGIEGQVTSAPDSSSVADVMEQLSTATKGGVGEIPRLIEQKTNTLTFSLGAGRYYGPAIAEYFDKLYGSSYLRYIVINNDDGTLFGLYPASDLVTYFRAIDRTGYARFEESLNSGDGRARDWLAQLPGFVPAKAALTSEVSKREALRTMADRELETLPVVDDGARFVGTVERAKLTTSLILAVTEKVTTAGAD